MMLADATPDANSFLQFWLILSLIFSTLTAIGTFLVMVSNRKQKREVNFAFEPASKDEFEKQRDHCTKRHAELFTAIEQADSGISDKTEKKIETIRHEVVGIAREVSEVQAETKLQSQQLNRVDAKLDRLIERKS